MLESGQASSARTVVGREMHLDVGGREHNIDEVRGASESWRPTEEWRRSQLFVRQRVGDSAKPHAARVGLARLRRYFYVPQGVAAICCAAASIGSSYDGVPYSLVRGRCGKKREESGWCQGSDGLTPMLYADPRRWSTPRARPKRQADPPTFACVYATRSYRVISRSAE